MRKKETPNPSRVRGRGVEVSETLFIAIFCDDITENSDEASYITGVILSVDGMARS